ncbi:MAG: group II intron reverse transcriptase/maturase [Deltaproteobacteria bacterium]|jgi:RNA-directed DNA polymerase|nr:group II intron reverse transcriptase/maturase [Deltaproteobacteria bacterium]
MRSLQQQKQLELNLGPVAEMPPSYRFEEFIASHLSESPTGQIRLMESILERNNMKRAVKRVIKNKGAPGVDGMTVRKIKKYLKRHWSKIEQALLDGTYSPMPVKRKEISKPGGIRLLGIPTVLDRVIQQAVAQVLNQIWDHTFSEYSFGFRPNRSQHDAIRHYREYVRCGYRFVIDIDLSKFFDRVNHDRLMSRLATRIKDKRVLKLIRSFLTSGIMIGGLVEPSREGTPQGGPLSPLLSNIVLDELDKELESRGLCFVRYADDSVIFVRSERAGRRVMESVSRFIEKKLRLKINRQKSAVGRPWDRKYLGFCMTNSRKAPKIRIHWKTIKRFKERVREITARRRGRSISQVIRELNTFTRGWWNYYGITESYNRLRSLAHWIRRRLRAVIWKHWKNRRTRVRELLKRGVTRNYAVTTGCARKGPWRMSKVKWVNIALPDAYFSSLCLLCPWI